MPKIRLATDVGGTFTDAVYYETDEITGEIHNLNAVKTHTTPPNFEEGVLNATNKAKINLSNVEFFAHGTTVVINALTERKGVKTALITTEGFRDILEIGRGNRPDFFNLRYKKPEPFVPRYLRREIPERMTYKGEIYKELDMSGLSSILDAFKEEGVQSVAICFLHSYANPAHEIAVAKKIKDLWPGVSVVSSHEITREWREYERSNTTVLCAYIKPMAHDYLMRMDNEIRKAGFTGSFYIMQSNGGIDTLPAARDTPISMVESGPASGVLGAAALGKLIGIDHIIALDIGGTTAKCSLIDNGRISITSQYMIEKSSLSAGYPIMTPVIDIVEIGNGGGSIAWFDEDKKMHVGPKSAGALPGPVAYGKGGTEPTTTDANLMLGRINPNYFIAGEIQADMDAVKKAFINLGQKNNLSPEEAARGVIRIANNNMVNALKLVSINKGYDPRDFTMIAFGGGGAMHATALAKELSIPKVVIPNHSAVFSAWGMLMSDLRRDYIRTQPMVIDLPSAGKINQIFKDMEDNALLAFSKEKFDASSICFERYVDLRYDAQEHSVKIGLTNLSIDTEEIKQLLKRFQDAYKKKYTYTLDKNVELVSFHLVAFCSVDMPQLTKLENGISADNAVKEERLVDFDQTGIVKTKIYDRSCLLANISFIGPAIIEEPGGTSVVFPDQKVFVDDFGNLNIEI